MVKQNIVTFVVIFAFAFSQQISIYICRAQECNLYIDKKISTLVRSTSCIHL